MRYSLVLLLLALVPNSGCQCLYVTEVYQDGIDKIADYRPHHEKFYYPTLDVSRIGHPDWCRSPINRLLCGKDCKAGQRPPAVYYPNAIYPGDELAGPAPRPQLPENEPVDPDLPDEGFPNDNYLDEPVNPLEGPKDSTIPERVPQPDPPLLPAPNPAGSAPSVEPADRLPAPPTPPEPMPLPETSARAPLFIEQLSFQITPTESVISAVDVGGRWKAADKKTVVKAAVEQNGAPTSPSQPESPEASAPSVEQHLDQPHETPKQSPVINAPRNIRPAPAWMQQR